MLVGNKIMDVCEVISCYVMYLYCMVIESIELIIILSEISISSARAHNTN